MTPDSGWTRRQLTFGLLRHRRLPCRSGVPATVLVSASL